VRVVLDSNVIMSGIFFRGVPGQILSAWRDRLLHLVLSPSILHEYLRVGALLGERYQSADFERFAALLALNALVVDAPEHLAVQICTDPDDDKFLACALVARTKVIVSGDPHLLKVSGWNGIEVIKPRTFVERYLKGDQ
jgi:uncharacterized protein